MLIILEPLFSYFSQSFSNVCIISDHLRGVCVYGSVCVCVYAHVLVIGTLMLMCKGVKVGGGGMWEAKKPILL